MKKKDQIIVSGGRFEQVKNNKPVILKSGRGRLQEVVAHERYKL